MFSNRNEVPHYQQGPVESIDVMAALMSKEEMRGHLWGCALKYVYRWKNKGGVDDLHKARTYLGWLIEWEESHG